MVFEFVIFGLILLGIILFHKHALKFAFWGMCVVLLYKMISDANFHFWHHLGDESILILNLFGLLVGFEVLSFIFRRTGLADLMPNILPNNWLGPFFLLLCVFSLSAVLDNIAAAKIGAAIAYVVFNRRIHLAFLIAIVAASNGGGASFPSGDTTTTMGWIQLKSGFFDFTPALIPSLASFFVYGVIAALIQHKHQKIQADAKIGVKINWQLVSVVLAMVVFVVVANIIFGVPAVGLWAVIGLAFFAGKIRKRELMHASAAVPSSAFLLCLVFTASMMPVENLPEPTWQSTLQLGFLSGVFDNIPLTKLALDQGGYDWPLLMYAVGFGGTMTNFGSSAAVGLWKSFPQTKSFFNWITKGWFVHVAYMLGFFVSLAVRGWQPGF